MFWRHVKFALSKTKQSALFFFSNKLILLSLFSYSGKAWHEVSSVLEGGDSFTEVYRSRQCVQRKAIRNATSHSAKMNIILKEGGIY